MPSERILIVGGLGLVGSKAAEKLLQRGYDVSVFDAATSSGGCNVADRALAFREPLLAGCTHRITGDIRSARDLTEAIALAQPDRIAHLAAVSHPPASDELAAALETTLPPIATLLGLGARSRIKRFLLASSSMVYGPFRYSPADEDHPRDPLTVYGSLKLSAELLTRSLAIELGVSYSIVRPITIYGPGAISGKLSMQKLLDILHTSEYRTGSQSDAGTDYTYYEDTAEGIVLALLADAADGQAFNISRGRSRTAEEVIAALNAQGFDVRPVAAADGASNSPKRGALSVEKAARLLRYSPRWDLEEGLAACVEYLERVEGLSGRQSAVSDG